MSNIQSPAPKLGKAEFIALVAALMALNALAIDVMLPALPYMGDALNVAEPNERQLVISVYLLGFGAFQIVYGPLTDRFGRRKPLLAGIVVYVIACLSAILAPSFGALLALRFVQGIGAAGTRVIALSVVRDTYSGRAMGEVMSFVFMIFMLIPVIAPSIGQVLLLTGDWWHIFIFMGGLATAIGLWATLRLPETLQSENRRELRLKVIAEGFALVFSNRLSISYSLAGTFLFGAMIGFVNSSQQIYGQLYGLGEMFPLVFAILGSTMALSSFLNARVVRRFGMRRISHFAMLSMTAVALIWATISLFGPMPLHLCLGLQLCAMFMFGWAASNMNSLAMEPLGKVAGTASAVFGFLQTVGGATIGLVIGQLYNGTVTPVASGYALLGCASLIAILVAENGKLFGVGAEYAGAQSAEPSH